MPTTPLEAGIVVLARRTRSPRLAPITAVLGTVKLKLKAPLLVPLGTLISAPSSSSAERLPSLFQSKSVVAASAKAVGALAEVASPDGKKRYTYDALGRPETTTLDVGGESFATKLSYDDLGRVDTIRYPATALGKRRAAKAEKPLQRLFDRGDKSAAAALGQLGSAELARSITEKIGSLPDAQVAALLGGGGRRGVLGSLLGIAGHGAGTITKPDPVAIERPRADALAGPVGPFAIGRPPG